MYKCLNKFTRTILGGALLCMVMLAFTSCENFLNGANIKQELEENIEIANSNPVTIYVEAEEGSGTVTPAQLRLKKKEKFELLFKPAENWRFVKWEVYNRKTEELVTDAIEFEDETSAETKAKLVKPQDDLAIYAKATLIPKIVSVTPENNSTNPVYTPIVITFNTPVEEPEVENSIFTFDNDNISITSSYGSVKEYFEKPAFNAEKTVLTIKPKAKQLNSFINTNHVTHLDINISFSEKIIIEKDEYETILHQDNNASFSILYKPAQDNNSPVKGDFFASTKPITLDNVNTFAQENKVVLPEECTIPSSYNSFEPRFFRKNQVLKNTTASMIYIYGKYSDEESGVDHVTIHESRIKDKKDSDSDVLYDSPIAPVTYNSTNAVFTKNGIVTEFIIAHKVQSKAGAVMISASVFDGFDNKIEKSFYIFKISDDNFIYFEPTNILGKGPGENSYETISESKFTSFKSNLKRIFIPKGSGNDCFNELIFKGYYTSGENDNGNIYADRSKFTFNCTFTYNNKEYQASDFHEGVDQDDSNIKYWYCDLYIDTATQTYVPSVSGLKVKITVTDEFENSMTNEYSYPKQPIPIVEDDTRLTFINGEDNNYYLIVRKDYEGNLSYSGFNDRNHPYYFTIDRHSEYQVIPVNRKEYNDRTNEPSCFFCGDISSSFNTETPQPGELDYKVQLQEEEAELQYFEEDKNWGVELLLADGTWSDFDSIYYTVEEPYSDENKYYVKPGSDTVKYLIPDDEGSVIQLYSDNLTLYFYGIKDGNISTPLVKTVTTKTNNSVKGKYDLIKPEITVSRKDLYTYTVNVTDEDSGPDKLYLVKPDGTRKLIKENITNASSFNVMAKDVESGADSFGTFILEATDKNDNKTQISRPKTIFNGKEANPIEISYNDSKWSIATYQTSATSTLYLNTLIEDSSNEFYLKWKYGTISSSSTSIPNNSFIRVDNQLRHANGLKRELGYAYFYTSEIKSSGRYDYIQAISDTTFLVASDAPVLVQTIRTDRAYDECKNWTRDEWEVLNDICCVKTMNLSQAKPFDFYVISSDQIKAGDCYVVIAYFPNGKGNTAIGTSSPVYRAEPAKSFMTDVMIAK